MKRNNTDEQNMNSTSSKSKQVYFIPTIVLAFLAVTGLAYSYSIVSDNQQKLEQKRVELEKLKDQVQVEKARSNSLQNNRVQLEKAQPNPLQNNRVKVEELQPHTIQKQQPIAQTTITPSSGNTFNKPINIYWSNKNDWTSQMPKNALALTFDDGPDPKYTEQILRELKKHNVKATFFVVGYRVKKDCDTVKRIVREGHELGNHTYNHPFLTKETEQTQKGEIKKTQQAIEDCVGKGHLPRWFRAPYGDQNKRILEIANDMGLNTALWTIQANDWHKDGTKKSIEDDLLESQGQNIALLHDGTEANPVQRQKDEKSKSPIIASSRQNTVDALDKSIRGLKQRGIKFVTMSEAFRRQ